jgi:diguanylate cyclase (GGDEF)-like protein
MPTDSPLCNHQDSVNNMKKAPFPENEAKRLEALRKYNILDTLPEMSFDDITRIASHISDTPVALISLVDSERQWFKSKIGFDIQETPRDISFCSHAILEPDILVVPDTHKDERFFDNPLVTGEDNIRFYAGSPLVTAKGETLGTLCVIDRNPRNLDETQKEALRALARQVMDQLELRKHINEQEQNKRELVEYQKNLEEANDRLEIVSLTDDVSGFHNTRFLHNFLERYLNPEHHDNNELSLIFFDMDNFKNVVDTYGHLIGTKVLREVALVVHHQLEPKDHIVRYGGDEYVVILPGQGKDKASNKAEMMKQAISSALFSGEEDLSIKITASFGLATYPEDARDKHYLLAAADKCLFKSKIDGKDRLTVK